MPDEHPDEQAGDDRVGDRAADQPVDLVEAVLEDPDADAERQRGDRKRPGIANHQRPTMSSSTDY